MWHLSEAKKDEGSGREPNGNVAISLPETQNLSRALTSPAFLYKVRDLHRVSRLL